LLHFSYVSLDTQSDDSSEPTRKDEKLDAKSEIGIQAQSGYIIVTSTTDDPILRAIAMDTPNELNNQSIKKDDVTSANHVLNQTQLSFLQNWNNITEKRRTTKVLGSYTIGQQLAAIGCKKIKIIGDGNCFFRAISYQLYDHEDEHLSIRCEAINHIKQNMNDFAPYIDRRFDSTIDRYIDRMSQNGTYADYLTIVATASIIERDIIVHEENRKPLLFPSSKYPAPRQLHVLYDLLREHYDCVFSSNDNLPFLSADQVVKT
jgi:hypothetical protein